MNNPKVLMIIGAVCYIVAVTARLLSDKPCADYIFIIWATTALLWQMAWYNLVRWK